MDNGRPYRPYHLYVVEDDAALRELLGTYSEKHGCVVIAVGSADELWRRIDQTRELLAQVHAVLPRAAPDQRADGDKPVKIGDYLFSAASRSLHRGAEVRVLNTVEYALLAELSAHPSEPVSRERLLAVSHTRKEAVLLRAVDAAIMRLRKAVEPDPAAPRFIQTVRGFGYMFVPGGEG